MTQWGCVEDRESADILTPGDTVDGKYCDAKQWGVVVDHAAVYGTLADMRRWAQSLLDQLPDDRDTPLVTVDIDGLHEWLDASDDANDPDFEVNVTSICDLMLAIAEEPESAGWTLGEGVEDLWAGGDENTGDLLAGISLVDGPQVGIGRPLTDADLTAAKADSVHDLTVAALVLVAHRINEAY